MATSTDDLRNRCRVLYDVAGSQVLDDSEWLFLLNDSYRKLWRTVTEANRDFRVSVDTFTLTTTQTRALPATFRETRIVRVNPGTENQSPLNRTTARGGQDAWERQYRLEGGFLYIEPLTRCAGNYEHRYVPNLTPLVAPSDLVDVELEQFAAFLVYDSVNVALKREETGPLYADDFAREESAAKKWAAAQRSADPDGVEDVKANSRTGRGWTP